MAMTLRLSEIKAPSVLETLERTTGFDQMGVFTVTYSLGAAGVLSELMLVLPLADRDLAALRRILALGGDFAAEPYLRFALVDWPGADPGTQVGLLGLRVDWQSSLQLGTTLHTSLSPAILPGAVEGADGRSISVLETLQARDYLPVAFCHRGKLLEVTVGDEAVPLQLPVALLAEHKESLAAIAKGAADSGLSQEDGVIVSLASCLKPGPEFNQALFQAIF